MAPSPALILHFPSGTSVTARDRLVARLTDFDLVAIHEDEVTAPTQWVVHFATVAARNAALAALKATPEIEGVRLEATEVPDDDWARRTQADLPAVRIGRVVVAPPWDMPRADLAERRTPGADIVLEIEPSRGFGTGHHQSTRLCLVLMQNRELAGRTVNDIGTGSGVLAIAAAKLGAAFVSAIDDDPDAVASALENIERNGVGAIVEAHVRDLQDPSLPPADVVTANLTGTLLARHAGRLARLVRSGGVLIVAGFTKEERHVVEDAFAPALAVSETAEEDDWWAFVLGREPRRTDGTGGVGRG